jgi:hypothetical protein
MSSELLQQAMLYLGEKAERLQKRLQIETILRLELIVGQSPATESLYLIVFASQEIVVNLRIWGVEDVRSDEETDKMFESLFRELGRMILEREARYFASLKVDAIEVIQLNMSHSPYIFNGLYIKIYPDFLTNAALSDLN